MFEHYGGGDWPSAVLPNAMNDTLVIGGFGYGKVIVDEQGIVRSINDFQIETILDKMFLLGTLDANSESESIALGGLWHNGKSWRYADNSRYNTDDIDRIVDEQIESSSDSYVELMGEKHSFDSVVADPHPQGLVMDLAFNQGQRVRILCSDSELNQAESKAKAKYFELDPSKPDSKKPKLVGRGDWTVRRDLNGSLTLSGNIRQRKKMPEEFPISVHLHESSSSMGNSTLKIEGNQAVLSGTLGVRTFPQVRDLIKNRPDIKTIAFGNVDGTANDEINLHTGRILRDAGLNTHINPKSKVSPAGVDLFCAGVNRTIAQDAELGVHSWTDGTYSGAKYPKDHPAHRYHLAYFERMLGEEIGAEFYFFALNSASAKSSHILGAEEIQKWRLETE